MGQEQIANKFEAAWSVFAQTCGHFWAPEQSHQAWFAHYLISQFGIDRVAREPILHIRNFTESPLKLKVGGGEVRPDIVVTREPGIVMPHYANRLGKASDLSGLGLLKTLAVVSEFKIGASAQNGLKMPDLIRDADKLQLLLNEFELKHRKRRNWLRGPRQNGWPRDQEQLRVHAGRRVAALRGPDHRPRNLAEAPALPIRLLQTGSCAATYGPASWAACRNAAPTRSSTSWPSTRTPASPQDSALAAASFSGPPVQPSTSPPATKRSTLSAQIPWPWAPDGLFLSRARPLPTGAPLQ